MKGTQIIGWVLPARSNYQHAPRPLPRFARTPAKPGSSFDLPRISLVTPALNAERFIAEAITSVLTQRYANLTYVVADGGSTDQTVAIARSLGDGTFDVRTGPDAGQGDAIRRTLDAGDGEILGWLNADDVLLPNALHTIGRFFADHPDVDVVYGHRLLIDEHSEWVGSRIVQRHRRSSYAIANFVPQETMYWRRRVWDAVGGIDARFQFAMDWDLILRFSEAGARFERLPVHLGAFRLHPEQKSSRLLAVGKAEAALLRRRTHGRELLKIERLIRLTPMLVRATLTHYCVLRRHRRTHGDNSAENDAAQTTS